MSVTRIIIIGLCFLSAQAKLWAQPRQKESLNSGWEFILNDQGDPSLLSGSKRQLINLPHTWNAADIIDDTVGYHQGIGWYKRNVYIPVSDSNKHCELFFEGVCNKTTVYINRQLVTEHIGGFTGFKVNLDHKILAGKDNEILVKVDNGKYLQDTVPPYSGDFNMMGGIYRDVWLVKTNKEHFDMRFGNDGLLIQVDRINEHEASYTINTFFLNGIPLTGYLDYQLLLNNRVIQSGRQHIQSGTIIKNTLKHPHLWSPESPTLYRLLVQFKNNKGELLDQLSQNVGFKWVGISDKKEFLLNGKPYQLKGASRHQDYKNIGTALTDAMHIRDIELMKEMGCNFIRIAHYPQDPAIYDACDRLGLIAWSEIPTVDKVVDNPTFFANSQLMMQEMIFQNYNHPCIAIWGYHNEVRNLDDATIRHARMLDSLAKSLDKSRLTAMAFESNIDAPYFKSPLLTQILSIADINGYNVYQGWYRGKYADISSFLDTLYAFNPSTPILLSEYGAGSVINIHSYYPTVFDFSEEYQLNFHESYLKAGNTKPWMIGFAIWNFIDFQRDGREDVVPNINKKGMVTTDRQPKDVYYYYQSQWAKKPVVYIAGKHWVNRIGLSNGEKKITIPLVVYSNKKQLTLFQDDIEVWTEKIKEGKFAWNATLKEGENNFICQSTDSHDFDMLRIHYTLIDTTAFATNTTWQQLNFNSGQSRTYFTDTKTNEQWMPDKPYTKGTWGYVAGKIWNTWSSAAWNGIREGIQKPIANSENEPLFQTFVEGLTNWKANVPPGMYRVTLLLCEPFTLQQRKKEERILNIYLNGQLWMKQLNLEKQYGVQTAVIIDREIFVGENEMIDIGFDCIQGKTILNGVSIHRL